MVLFQVDMVTKGRRSTKTSTVVLSLITHPDGDNPGFFTEYGLADLPNRPLLHAE